jgi:hypothetical protein
MRGCPLGARKLPRAELLPNPTAEQIMSMSAVSPRRWKRAEVDRLPYLVEHTLGEIVLGPAELPLVSGERYEPDLFVVALSDGRRPALPLERPKPILICEILSPDDERPIIDQRFIWSPVGAAARFELDVAAFFASVADGAPPA